jgi:hypothetical protein
VNQYSLTQIGEKMRLNIIFIMLIISLIGFSDNLHSQVLGQRDPNISEFVYNSLPQGGGIIVGYSPLEYGFLIKIYGVPRDLSFKLRLNYFVIYVDSNGEPKGEYFEEN